MTGRRDARRAVPRDPWSTRLTRALLRWAGRVALGALAGTVVVAATVWAGTSWASARWLGVGAAALVVLATTLAATLPPLPEPLPDPVPERRDDGR